MKGGGGGGLKKERMGGGQQGRSSKAKNVKFLDPPTV